MNSCCLHRALGLSVSMRHFGLKTTNEIYNDIEASFERTKKDKKAKKSLKSKHFDIDSIGLKQQSSNMHRKPSTQSTQSLFASLQNKANLLGL